MGFFKFSKEIKTEDLKLSDYNQIWSKFCFLDETGSLNNTRDPFFTVGILKLTQPYYLMDKIQGQRQKQNFHDEMKFNKLSNNNIDFAKLAIDALFDVKSNYFYSYSIDKDGDYFKGEFAGDPWLAYQKLTLKLIEEAVLAPKEILILIADYILSPKNVHYEVSVKKEVNNFYKRLALAGVCCIDSRSNNLLQLVDLVIGSISYDLKISCGVLTDGVSKYKKELSDYLKKNLGSGNFIDGGFRNRNFNIFVDKDMKLRLPLVLPNIENEDNKKGPST